MTLAVQINELHWKLEGYKQRMTVAEWRQILLQNKDYIAYKGTVVRLVGTDIGHGVVEVTKSPLNSTANEQEQDDDK